MTESILPAKLMAASIIKSIKKAQAEELYLSEINSSPGLTSGENEFLFFIKPEITTPSDTIKLEEIVQLILEKINLFGLKIGDVRVLSAKYLDKYDIIAEHYGVINRMATNPIRFFSERAAEKFKEFYGASIHDVKVVGGLELLKQEPNFDPYTLDSYWKTLDLKKLASGVYCAKSSRSPNWSYLINGFHPRQLNHFTEKGKSIVVMALSGDLSWEHARNFFIGSTDPMKAEAGSLRRELLDRKGILGLAEISQSFNGIHLSAGPVEALCELKRFISDFSDANFIRHIESFSFGMKLSKVFDSKRFEAIIANTNIVFNGKRQSIFDLTENCNSTQAISLLQEVM
jgi:hypothetical protein